MVVRIRLQRFGRTHLPFYRIVVADSRCRRDGRFIERVGTYNPIPDKFDTKEITAHGDRIKYWLTCGAQPSDRVAWLFGKIGLLPPLPPRVPKYPGVPRSIVKAMEKAQTDSKAKKGGAAPEAAKPKKEEPKAKAAAAAKK
jgi:small subunit ribosomal protein S16